MGVVFAKTRKGQDEITSRAGGLTPRERRLLIFADGKRSLDELQRMLQADDLRPILEKLRKSGYIEAVDATSQANCRPTVHQLPADYGPK